MPVVRFAPRPTPDPQPSVALRSLLQRLARLEAQKPTDAAMLRDLLDRALAAHDV